MIIINIIIINHATRYIFYNLAKQKAQSILMLYKLMQYIEHLYQ